MGRENLQAGSLMDRGIGTKMNRGIISPRELEFLRSLAQLLDIGIGIIGPEGKLLSFFAGISFIFSYDRYPALTGLLEGFFYYLVKITNKVGEIDVIEDPLGIVVRPEGRLCLGIGGGLNQEKKLCRQDFFRRLKNYGVSEAEVISAGKRTVSSDELKSIAARIQAIYRWFTNTPNENEKPGETKLLLEASDKIDKLTVALLCSEHFDLRRVLELVAGSLITLCGAEGAWAFALGGAGGTTVCRGAE